MRVTFEELQDIPVEKMLVDECEDHHAGECIGYRCQECGAADETLGQLWHEDDCPLIGDHGRQHYEQLDRPDEPGPSPELDADNPIWVVESAETDAADGVYNGSVVAFLCRCGNLDDELWETVHDEGCPLSDDDCELGRTDVELFQGMRAVADGGGTA